MAGLRDLVSFDRVGDFWGILRELDPGAVERDARRTVRLVVCGPPNVGKRRLASELSSGDFAAPIVDVYDMANDVPIALPHADAYIYVTSSDLRNRGVEREHVRQLTHRGSPVLVVLTVSMDQDLDKMRDALASATGLDSSRVVAVTLDKDVRLLDEVVPALFSIAPMIALPLGRQLPAMRAASADRLVRETSRVNAEFAALSSLPSIVPIVGNLASMGADTVVLTKNQVMLLLKLAILHGRPMDNRLQVMSEILPIVGAGLFWRTVARGLISIIPGPFAVAPKVAVAYVGTYVVGKAAQNYYRIGQRPSPELLENFQREALEQLQTLLPILSHLGRRFPRP